MKKEKFLCALTEGRRLSLLIANSVHISVQKNTKKAWPPKI
jgi:hypothetical protein